MDKIFLTTTGKGLARAENVDGEWRVSQPLNGLRINCLVSDPYQNQRVYAGTQRDGILVSMDFGKTWQPSGMQGIPVKSLAVSSQSAGLIYAGCKPVSLYVSRDFGKSWQELEGMRRARRWWWFSPADPPGWTPYVMALTISPGNPNVMMAGIELGGVLRSEDGGLTWSKHSRGAVLDCHSLKYHLNDANWVYEAGGGGVAISRDGGLTWYKPKKGLTKKYGWMVAADPKRPEVWYLSASGMPNLLRGEFNPPAHVDGKANASIYRSEGDATLRLLSGGLPEPLDYMAYALVTDPQETGHLYAGLSNGEVWHTTDYGDSWVKLPFCLGGIHSTMIMI